MSIKQNLDIELFGEELDFIMEIMVQSLVNSYTIFHQELFVLLSELCFILKENKKQII